MRGVAPASHVTGRPLRRLAAVAVGIGAASVLTVSPPAHAVQHSQTVVVDPVPAAGTPNVNDGVVYSIAKVGDTIVLGGTFSSASPASDSGTVDTQPNTMAFDASTNAIDTTGYRPNVDGRVNVVIPGPKPHQVYVGGSFNNVDGTASRLALLDTRTGAIVSTWHSPALNGQVYSLVLSHGRLYVGGTFTTVAGHDHVGLVTLKPATGTPTSFVSLAFTGHHNYKRKCDPATHTCANGETGVRSIDVTPDGSTMVVLGNFVDVSGTKRDQIAMLHLGVSGATVRTDWNTKSYTAECFSQADDSYVRQVQFSPDGSYFVVVSTGGVGTNSDGSEGLCDAVARFNTGATGKNVPPDWADLTGEDTMWSESVTGAAVYVGGHQRWLNNSLGLNQPAAGAVPRPGIAALNPSSGMPLAWNPGRNPRGAGAFALLATSKGLWVGSDTDFIGNSQYLRKKVAFFPLAGGSAVPDEATPKLPGRIFLAGATGGGAPDPDRLTAREFNGSATGSPVAVPSGVAWGSVRGAFTVDGQLFYGSGDGLLHERSFDGSALGSETVLDPYDDPAWANVQTGSGQSYRGVAANLAAEMPSVTSMFFSHGRLFYTLAGDATMHWRWFEPEDGIVGAERFDVAGTHHWSDTAGAFYANGRVYYAQQSSGHLRSIRWGRRGHPVGASKLVDKATDWASRGLFLLSVSTNPTAKPQAAFVTKCRAGGCRFHATPWVDPDGGVVTYRWSFGDRTAKVRSTHPTVTHRYAANGKYRTQLAVSTTSGQSALASGTAHVNQPVKHATFLGSRVARRSHGGVKVAVPKHAKAGDTLLLLESYEARKRTPVRPAGWDKVLIGFHKGLRVACFVKRLRARPPSHLTATLSGHGQSVALLAAYRHLSTRPIEKLDLAGHPPSKSHPSPGLRNVTAGSLVVGLWAEMGSSKPKWLLPYGVGHRTFAKGRNIVLAFGDTAKPVSGAVALGTATTHRKVPTLNLVIALSPALK